jgi:murein L,D-transpeptidase YafK
MLKTKHFHKRILLLLTGFISIILISGSDSSFKENQLRYSRVRLAYEEKFEGIRSNLKDFDIQTRRMQLYLRVFKSEKLIEVWAKNSKDSVLQKVATYSICRLSGKLGPKRRQGDLQVPEGFYHINIFNPFSNYFLSLGINYPNTSDRILGHKGSLGGDIFIHGRCVTIGCLPITDNKIKELYVYCVEAKNNGQNKIPVTIFPAKMYEENCIGLNRKFKDNPAVIGLHHDLKTAYDIFEKEKRLPVISFFKDGRHEIN